MQAVLLSGAGQDGHGGTQRWDGSSGYQAPLGTNGRNGRDASHPTPGNRGGELHVGVSFHPDRPGLVQVVGEGHLQGKRWEIAGQQTIVLDCRGGKGGNGGSGEHGQPGGNGYPGQDATSYSAAGDGGPGGHGGNGGRGTSGAVGGPGGAAHITVSDEDLDTLLGVDWDVTGGKGGAPGQHGNGGDGGRGGSGGAGCWWSESEPYHVHNNDGSFSHTEYRPQPRSRQPGRGGNGGEGGNKYTDHLFAGANGQEGHCQITVVSRGSQRVVYPSRYTLVVMSFDVTDENEDSVMEPGEHLIVSNIVVKNIGGMTSPRANGLKVLIRSTKWLEAVLEPLSMPGDIQPGHSVRLPGSLKAYIKNEYAPRDPRGPSTVLRAKDVVSLRAYSERLQREVPEFRGGVPVTYEYPLVMSVPRYLDCVAKGDVVRFSWTIQNVSRKPYGASSALRRAACSSLWDRNKSFELKEADPNTPHGIVEMVDIIEPGGVVPLSVSFQVAERVKEYTTGSMVVKLKLSDPHTGELRTIVYFELPIQISLPYRYHPTSRFLLVINAQCRNDYTLQVIDFIENDLQLGVDVFNLSLSGSFLNASTGEEVLPRYSGKAVVIMGNTISYFQGGTREPWNLLDLDQVALLSRQGTSFLFLAPSKVKSLQDFARLILLPNVAMPKPAQAEFKDVSDALHKLTLEKPAWTLITDPVLTILAKKAAFRDLESSLQSKAKSTQEKLDVEFPLRRFLVAPCDVGATASESDAKKASIGAVGIVEGMPVDAKIIASTQSMGHVSSLTIYDATLIMHSLPFREQCAIFWNLLGWDLKSGISTEIAYAGDLLRSFREGPGTREKAVRVNKLVNGKACETLAWSIATQLASELAQFCVSSPWPDSSRSHSSAMAQLPRLNTFLSTAPKSHAKAPAGSTPTLVAIIGHIRGIMQPHGVHQWLGQKVIRVGSRESKVRALLSKHSDPLVRLCVMDSRETGTSMPDPTPDGSSTKKTKPAKSIVKSKLAQEEIDDIEARTKAELAALKKQKPQLDQVGQVHELACRRLAQLTSVPEAGFLDVNDMGGIRRSVTKNREEMSKWRAVHAERRNRLSADIAWSRERIREMIVPDGPQGRVAAVHGQVLPEPAELEDPGAMQTRLVEAPDDYFAMARAGGAERFDQDIVHQGQA